MRHIRACSALLIVVSAALPAPAAARFNPPIKWVGEGENPFKRGREPAYFDRFKTSKVWFANHEIQELGVKVGMPLRTGVGIVGRNVPDQISASIERGAASTTSATAIVQTDPDNNRGPAIRKTSPSGIDLSGDPPNTKRYVWEEGDTYDPVIRRRALELFPADRRARLLWMAVQEQQATQNQINSSKSLIYPVGSR